MDTPRRNDGGSQGVLYSCCHRSVGRVPPILAHFAPTDTTRPPMPKVYASSYQFDQCSYRRVHRSYAVRSSLRHTRAVYNFRSSSILAQIPVPGFILGR